MKTFKATENMVCNHKRSIALIDKGCSVYCNVWTEYITRVIDAASVRLTLAKARRLRDWLSTWIKEQEKGK